MSEVKVFNENNGQAMVQILPSGKMLTMEEAECVYQTIKKEHIMRDSEAYFWGRISIYDTIPEYSGLIIDPYVDFVSYAEAFSEEMENGRLTDQDSWDSMMGKKTESELARCLGKFLTDTLGRATDGQREELLSIINHNIIKYGMAMQGIDAENYAERLSNIPCGDNDAFLSVLYDIQDGAGWVLEQSPAGQLTR